MIVPEFIVEQSDLNGILAHLNYGSEGNLCRKFYHPDVGIM
jgi:hypothetical protein